MRFKNIPVYFDAQGRAHLRGERWVEPFMIFQREKPIDVAPRDGSLCDFDVDPMTRVGGALSLHTVVDLENRQVVDAFVEVPLFRGFEVILQGREVSDAVHISSRACGACSGAHAVCSALALEMAAGVTPPPLALVVRNLGEAMGLVADHLVHLFLLAGPDYSGSVVERTTPTFWARAEKADAPHDTVHGFRTLADIMRGLNSIDGRLSAEALRFVRTAREVATLLFGKVPHPSTIYPAGLGIEPSASLFNQVFGRVVKLLDYAKKVVAVWDDVVDFFYTEMPDSERVGERAVNLLSAGLWDDPDAYDASFTGCAHWGEQRLVTPGVVVSGELRTTHLDAVNLGIEEFVDHSYYRAWDNHRFSTDPLGAPLSPFNPWNKQTLPQLSRRSWKEKYTWSTAPRWDRVPMEAGPLSRHWITALARRLKSEFIRSVPGGLEIDLPRGETPAVTLTWQIPTRANALERNRARAYHVAYAGMAAYAYLLKAFQYLRQGQTMMAAPYTIPKEAVGVGFWESARGALTHHVELRDGRIANYQILTPSTWTASPRDLFGVPGPVEEAVVNTPILEEFDRAEEFTGIDILRAIRSFDPCMSCAVH